MIPDSRIISSSSVNLSSGPGEKMSSSALASVVEANDRRAKVGVTFLPARKAVLDSLTAAIPVV